MHAEIAAQSPRPAVAPVFFDRINCALPVSFACPGCGATWDVPGSSKLHDARVDDRRPSSFVLAAPARAVVQRACALPMAHAVELSCISEPKPNTVRSELRSDCFLRGLDVVGERLHSPHSVCLSWPSRRVAGPRSGMNRVDDTFWRCPAKGLSYAGAGPRSLPTGSRCGFFDPPTGRCRV
jgi:hypothetical protein